MVWAIVRRTELPDETGVIILSAENNSLLARSGLQSKDVIRSAGEKPVKDVKQLIDTYQALNWTGHMPLTVIVTSNC
ncbi:MAG: hypothetical protein M9904_11885 [Chitinophagaceae bacterium]|nr:hypothetical protein [Chitinophagaceae bacterium]